MKGNETSLRHSAGEDDVDHEGGTSGGNSTSVPPPTPTRMASVPVTDEAFIKRLIASNEDSIEMNNKINSNNNKSNTSYDEVVEEKVRGVAADGDPPPSTQEQETVPATTTPRQQQQQQQQRQRAVRQHGAQAVYPAGSRRGGRNSNDIQEDESLYSSDIATTENASTATTSANDTSGLIQVQEQQPEEGNIQVIQITEAENIPQAMVDELNETQQKNQQLAEQLRKLQEQTSNVIVASHVDVEEEGGGGKGASTTATTSTGKRYLAVLAVMVVIAVIVVGVAISKENNDSSSPDEPAGNHQTTKNPGDSSYVDDGRTTLQRIRDRGYLRCSSFDFAFIDDMVRTLTLL